MNIRSILLLVALVLLPAALTAQVSLTQAFSGISFSASVDIQAPPDGTDRLFVVERGGTIRIVDDIFGTPVKLATPFFTIPDGTFASGGERGLLGMAFHPDYENNGYFFVFYTVDPSGSVSTRTVVSRFTVSSGNANLADPSTELDIIGVDHRFSNHNAGQLQFGPDGYLYIGMGDGGSGGDPDDNGQDKGNLLASMLRVDVDGGGLAPDNCGDITPNYTVPADNPFVDGNGGDCDELFAIGLRNPWRFSFGPDGKFWVADVGQNAYEEISWVANGNNMGWNEKEGNVCYPSGSPTCNDPQYTDPVYTHPHSFGASISGGYVYTGSECGALSGQYVFADYVLDFVRSLAYDDNGVTAQNSLTTRSSITTFGVDRKKNLYVATIGGSLLTLDCSNLNAVNVRALFQGPYVDGSNSMINGLNVQGLLPTTQPYSDAAFDGMKTEHDGNESLPSDFFMPLADVIDWVVVELRQTPSAAPAVKRAAFIRNDGSITDFDGGPVRFLNLSGSFHVVLHHRNHLSIMSSSAITLSGTPALYDFTSAESQAYGTTNPMTEVDPGIWAMWAGDGDADSNTTAFDFSTIFLPQNGTNGYLSGDFNLSGQVTAFDFLEIWLVSNGRASQVP